MTRFHAVIAAALLLLSAGCGKSDTTTPSTNGGSNAVINGDVSGGGSGSTNAVRTSALTSIVVTIAGTSISATVNPTGHFVLHNVPSGTIELIFTGPGLNARITLENIESTETVDLRVTIAGSDVQLDTDSRRGGSEAQLEGRVESLPPTTAANAFLVGGKTVTVTTATEFRRGDAVLTFADLQIGARVHVKGRWEGETLVARRVEIQGTNTSAPVNVNGIIRSFEGSPAAFSFTLDGRLIKGDDATSFKNSRWLDLADGVRAEVKGVQRDGFVLASEIHVHRQH